MTHTTNTPTTPVLTQAQFQTIYSSPLLLGDPSDWHHRTQLLHILQASRPWFKDLTIRFNHHPALKQLFNQYKYSQYIADWREMILEWPHESEEQPGMVAYTQNEDKGVRDIQTRITLGKYLRRHCPTMPDHVLRDFCALHDTTAGYMHITNDLNEIIEAVQQGPSSCMQDDSWDDTDEDGDYLDHPYRVYDPEFGWHMAIRKVGDQIIGRCLCLAHGEAKFFVRSYRKTDSQSPTDTALEAWLTNQGYEKLCEWPEGTRLACVTNSFGDTLMPYIDGENKRVAENTFCFVIHSRGEYRADNTDGLLQASGYVCPDCGDTVDEDDTYSTGYHGDHSVCRGCLEGSYVSVYGRCREQYYVHQGDAVWVEGWEEYVDNDYLEHNDIVWCEDRGEYWRADDCWQCQATNEWYPSEHYEYVLVDDETYHPDHAPETEEETEQTT